jgi:diamine N-acetyltransferase
MNIDIEKVSINDVVRLQKIGKQTFYETFSKGNTEENMTNYLEEGFSFQKLSDEINDINSEFYFSICDNNVVGYLKLNFEPSQTEIQKSNSLEIERIYVTKEFQGKNVGQLLFDKAMQIAKQKKSDFIWLGVWEENPKAINFYCHPSKFKNG